MHNRKNAKLPSDYLFIFINWRNKNSKIENQNLISSNQIIKLNGESHQQLLESGKRGEREIYVQSSSLEFK